MSIYEAIELNIGFAKRHIKNQKNGLIDNAGDNNIKLAQSEIKYAESLLKELIIEKNWPKALFYLGFEWINPYPKTRIYIR